MMIEESTKANFSPLFGLDIINALQTILARSEQAIIPDQLETLYSKFPNTDQSATHNDQSIHTIIAERQQQLDAVLHDISGLESVMYGLVSRLWRLPTEVLSQIFHHCLLPESNRPSELEAPVSLTAVCRRWREVALDTPSLWCRVSVGFDKLPYRYLENSQAFRYDVWLKRYWGRPLSLALVCGADDSTMLRSLLQPYTYQILSLSITFYEDAIEPELLLDDLPALQELTIQALKQHKDRYTPAIGQYLPRLPATLRSLKVIEQFFHIEQTYRGLAGLHLTNLDIAILLHQSTVIQLLQLYPNLLVKNIREILPK
ncbi:hypothetical protein DFJ58DRAFT_893311 [Suillus subalutaceus]|uniref:uncharacterized protein n=1 Tax=Suillus subalutaceus TaxID=48586 RepID=UPI001B86F61A|nr:uncharacterized protein DFJ58DRAFT_893311 [Suillus subalutaceus]KAG1845864.1 hypothetical protein DFJ58DRAFT_893311 [Suillus subalutaceus]